MIKQVFLCYLYLDLKYANFLWGLCFLLPFFVLVVFFPRLKRASPEPDTPFYMVLIDIKKAAENKEIHCIQKALDPKLDHKFIALSYRWGELQDQLVDTGCGYLASVTSFDLRDFYTCCQMITKEPDLKEMNYVWVDAICVDQKDHSRRKNTIYRMTEIYQCANYIVAVPDLHMRHLYGTSLINFEVMTLVKKHRLYLYHIFRKNMDQCIQLDEAWLSNMGVPKNNALHPYFCKYNNNNGDDLTDNILNLRLLDHNNADDVKNALHDTKKLFSVSQLPGGSRQRTSSYQPLVASELKHCSKLEYNPYYPLQKNIYLIPGLYDSNNDISTEDEQCSTGAPTFEQFDNEDNDDDMDNDATKYSQWLHRLLVGIHCTTWKQCMAKKSLEVKRSMTFLNGLISDWSERVWVISEFHIAKKKNNKKMKFWFIQLCCPELCGRRFPEFDFGGSLDDDAQMASLKTNDDRDDGPLVGASSCCCCDENHMPMPLQTLSWDAHMEFVNFKTRIRNLLANQTTLSMILHSKATKNEDRFYAILPSSEYSSTLAIKGRNTVSDWHITDMMSVKLKLYEFLNVRDKWLLVYLCCRPQINLILPTFATGSISWNSRYFDISTNTGSFNFQQEEEATLSIELMQHQCRPLNRPSLSCSQVLRLLPKQYHLLQDKSSINLDGFTISNQKIWRNLGIDPKKDNFEAVCIPLFEHHPGQVAECLDPLPFYTIQLVGNLDKNRWVVYEFLDLLSPEHPFSNDQWSTHHDDHQGNGFYVY